MPFLSSEIFSPPPLSLAQRKALDAAVEAYGKSTIPVSDEQIDTARHALWLLRHGASYLKEKS